MTAALTLGRRGQGRVWPNPAVGCVIVKDGIVVGRARTADGGRPHAETQALTQAGDAARGATAYVTLEPCAHHGQTGPCAEALVASGVARVVVATGDPDPRVSGKGLNILRAGGVEVNFGVCQAEADRDLAGFFLRVREGRPFVTLKLATSVDGRIATRTGHSQWITGPEARRVVHAMRARHDAVMVGAGTARADDPSLNVRDMGDVPQPVRVVVSSDLNILMDGKLAQTAGEQPVWLVHGEQAVPNDWVAKGARSIAVPVSDGAVDIEAALNSLGEAGLTSIFCEGGGALAGSLIKAGLVDELVVFAAGLTIGGDGTPAVAAMGIDDLSLATRFDLAEFRAVGPDTLSIWRPKT
ncbi:diaminohydroxyphosphoribosylaminopyrimidine deaminase / 5-amino-6-(5-phosphoribosylamino)uracil reductase [Cognatiyoonia sediminum]|uniref:Riboflavin biosynthesis protein RibD n=2 Tax=Cognatiyoonia sediminum TaxID=1508389 RepID=A0A1M5N2M6_9RHOB|nr:diaminohydroxyphosphoribosylaminopyrimidine deaminase / 5-amino-6-(5-phosphoribosylamino)uracil reductase [Cognatiyoonia sediminum]